MGNFLQLKQRFSILLNRGGTLGSLLNRLSDIYVNRTLVFENSGIQIASSKQSLTYKEALDIVSIASYIIQKNYSGHNTLILQGQNGYSFFLALLAISHAGKIAVPVNHQMRPDEIDHIVKEVNCPILHLEELYAHIDKLKISSDFNNIANTYSRPVNTSDENSTATILYTSGTTGKPKGAVLTHKSLLDQVSRLLMIPISLEKEKICVALPTAHIMGLAVLLGAASSGVAVISLPKFNPIDVLKTIEKESASIFIGVPAMYRMMLDANANSYNLKSIKLWISAADIMSYELAKTFKKMGATYYNSSLGISFGEATFADGYGMVELAGAVAAKISLPYLPLGLGNSVGIPLPPYKFKVVDENGNEVTLGQSGELCVKGPGVLKEYYNNISATKTLCTNDGWLYTGDIARRDRFGMVSFAGRKKDVIKHGGYSVFPAEIEEVIRTFPGIKDCAVIGRADKIKGEVPVALFETMNGFTVSITALNLYLQERISEYKIPIEFYNIESLPRTATNKIAKQILKSNYSSYKKE